MTVLRNSILLASVVATACAPRAPNYAASCSAAFSPATVQRDVRGAVVRVVSDVGVGTGFVAAQTANHVLIATNNHVVRDGARIDVVFDSGTKLSDLQVVKVDADHDLALIEAPLLAEHTPVLTLASRAVTVGEHVAAIGYPYVSGETPAMTFEDGGISSTSVELGDQHYIQTNANINPGSSGSPVVDACGVAVGVVVAVATETKRTGFVIPIDHLRTLIAAAQAPRPSPEAAITDRLHAFTTAFHHRRDVELAGMFSRAVMTHGAPTLLEARVADVKQRFEATLVQRAKAGKPLKIRGKVVTKWDAVPESQRAPMLDDRDIRDFELARQLTQQEDADETKLVQAWFGGYVNDLFGDNPTFAVDRVVASGDSAHSEVQVGGGDDAQFWQFDWVFERGDWYIDDFACQRGCTE